MLNRNDKKAGYFSKTERKAFDAGCYFALAIVQHCKGSVEEAAGAMGMNQVEADKLNIDPYDMKVLRPVLAEITG